MNWLIFEDRAEGAAALIVAGTGFLLAGALIMEHIFMNQVWVFGFDELARAANADLDAVEWLLMKAMALGLIKGEIDEVAKAVKISWLQPKVLDNTRIKMLQERIGLWKHSINSVLTHIELQSKEILE